MTAESLSAHPVSRRRVLTTAAGAGAAIAVASAAGAGLSSMGAGPSGTAGEDVGQTAGPIVVHVRDVSSGLLDVFSGTHRVEIKDRALARSIAGAAHSVSSTSV